MHVVLMCYFDTPKGCPEVSIPANLELVLVGVRDAWPPYWTAIVEEGLGGVLEGGKQGLLFFPLARARDCFQDFVFSLQPLLQVGCVILEGS